MTRRNFLALLPAAALAQSRPTNVVFFMTDDQGAWALGHAGCTEMHTPHLDRLAATGLRFTRAYACTPVCSPSRATYYTGKLPSQHGVQDFLLPADSHGAQSHRFLAGQTTFADVLKANGYTCGLVGKWHLGEDDKAQAGFDYWYSALGGGGPYKDTKFFVNGTPVEHTRFKTDFVGDGALDFLDKHHARPFCLVVPFFAPHEPFDYQPEKYREPYAEAQFGCYPRLALSPQRRGRFEGHHGNRESYTSYSALVTAVDANVGRVLDKLEALGVRENTVVIFTADHGFNCGHHGVWGKGNATIPFNMYDESIQVPLLWNQPGRIAPGEVPAMVSSYHFFPTLLEYLGVEAQADPERNSESYAAFLRGEDPPWTNELCFEFGYVRAIRTEKLKYVQRADGWGDELFDLELDPEETVNRVGKPEYRERRDALKVRLQAFFERAGAPPIDDWRSTTTQTIPTDIDYYRWEEPGR